MRTILGIVILLNWQVGPAQVVPTFSKIFGTDSSLGYGGVSIASFGDSIYFSMFEQDLAVNYQATTFVKCGPLGIQTAANRFYKPNFNISPGIQGSLKITTDGYLICGGSEGSRLVQADSGIFFKFDRNNLDTVFVKYYNDGNRCAFYGCGETSDGDYIFTGETGNASLDTDAAWVIKTDTGGNIIWQKTLSSDKYSAAGYISSFANGYYLPWGTSHPMDPNNPGDSAIFVDQYTNTGRLLWRDTFGIVGHDNKAGPIIGLREGGGIAVVNVLDTAGDQWGPLAIYKFDSLGSLRWVRYFPIEPLFLNTSNMIETRSGSLVICGSAQYGFLNFDSSGHESAALFKMDKDGNLIFFQFYNYDTSWQDILFDITETADGGYACIGNAYQRILPTTNYQRAWLLKVDSNGCLNGDCPHLFNDITALQEPLSFFVFPNPVETQFTVALSGPQDIQRYQHLLFNLYDLTGRLVGTKPINEQTTIIERGGLGPGLYLWQLCDDKGPVRKGKLCMR